MASHGIAHPKKRAFLAALAQLGNVTAAAEHVGVARRTHYDWLEGDDAEGTYAAAVREAIDQAGDLLEKEARRRAVEGVEKPVYQGGNKVGTIQEYSDVLLIFLLKGARPAKYRERYDVSVRPLPATSLSPDQLERVAAGESLEAVLGAAAVVPPAIN
jgi:hypothetical protein